jgi:hypothetical protein
MLGCSEGNNVQNRPIGQSCSSNSECGTKPYNCETTGYPGGYCQKDCVTDGDCPADSACVGTECRRKCTGRANCRESEGYDCRVEGQFMVCDVSSSAGDGGSP